MRVLVLGGTSEASVLAERLAVDRRFETILSLAGRTARPKLVPVEVRSGGFGGVGGLAAYLAAHTIDVVLDATHPFAAQISGNAIQACQRASIPLIALERLPWEAVTGDRWQHHNTVEDAIAALPANPQRIFSGLGRLSLDALNAAPQHHYVIRIIDPLDEALPLPHSTLILARGPFEAEDDIILFRAHAIEAVLAKNSGGNAAVSKIDAARALGLTVHMIARPVIPDRPVVRTINDAWDRLTAHHASPAKRGV